MRIAVEALACERGDRLVFRDLSLSLRPGEALLVRGPNGAGKSSLLRILAGLLAPLAGAIRIDDKEVGDDAAARRAAVAYLGHLDAVKPLFSAAENVADWCRLHGAARDEAGARADAALRRLGAARFLEVPARLLSAGQRKRIALARLATSDRALWLLDEPTVSLDSDGTGALERVLRQHLADGGSLILATHQAIDIAAGELVLGEAPA